MSDELKKLLEEQNTLHTEFKAYADKADAEIKKLGVELPETKAALAKMEERFTKLEEAMTKANRPGNPAEEKRDKDQKSVLAFRKALKTPDRLTEEDRKYINPCVITQDGEVKSLTTDNFSAAGALVAPAQFAEGILKDVSEVSPVRELARNISMTGKSILISVRTAPAVMSWTAEGGTRTEDTSLRYGRKELFAHAGTILYKATLEQLEDSAFAIESEIAAEFLEACSVGEGTAFISGDAVGKPEGLLTNADIGSINSGSNTVITADNLIDLVAEQKSVYNSGSYFLMHRKTLAFVRKLKAGDGHYLWQPAFDKDNPPMLEGFPYRFSPDMAYPTSGTFTKNVYPVLFGNFQNGYRVGTRKAITVQRLVEKYAETGEVGFLGTIRVGGLVANAAAIKKLKVST